MADQENRLDMDINKEIAMDAPASKVWNALTNPEFMKLWMSDAEMNIVTDWKIGSPIIFRGDLHGINYINKGTVLQFDPGKILQYTYWSSLSEQTDIPGNYSLITFRLTAENNKTYVSLTQSNFMAKTTYQHFNFYWNIALGVLRKLMEN